MSHFAGAVSSWFTLVGVESSWLILVGVESSWLILVGVESFWSILVGLESSWFILVGVESSWFILVGVESCVGLIKILRCVADDSGDIYATLRCMLLTLVFSVASPVAPMCPVGMIVRLWPW